MMPHLDGERMGRCVIGRTIGIVSPKTIGTIMSMVLHDGIVPFFLFQHSKRFQLSIE